MVESNGFQESALLDLDRYRPNEGEELHGMAEGEDLVGRPVYFCGVYLDLVEVPGFILEAARGQLPPNEVGSR